jgi:hypothetical protein
MPAKLRLRAAAIASLYLLGAAINAAYAKDPALLSLGMEHFRDTATVTDDPADAKVTITTEKGFIDYSGPLHMVWHDEFLSVTIDKKTDQKSFQVHQEITYSGNWRSYETASFQTASGPRSVPTTLVAKEAANCSTGECLYTEHVAFPVDEQLLRQQAAGYVPGHPVIWTYKVIAKSGSTYSGGLSNAEIAGLLAKLDGYTVSPAPAAAAPSPPLVQATLIGASSKLDLGIGGLFVAATAEQPNRAGILVTEVTRGSVAQKSGLIVGDILSEFNGQTLRSVAELQAAIAACHANSAVPIRLYRGLERMTVTARF